MWRGAPRTLAPEFNPIQVSPSRFEIRYCEQLARFLRYCIIYSVRSVPGRIARPHDVAYFSWSSWDSMRAQCTAPDAANRLMIRPSRFQDDLEAFLFSEGERCHCHMHLSLEKAFRFLLDFNAAVLWQVLSGMTRLMSWAAI